jgi:hypothetical protein
MTDEALLLSAVVLVGGVLLAVQVLQSAGTDWLAYASGVVAVGLGAGLAGISRRDPA